MTGSINIWYPHTHNVGDIFSEMIAFEWIILRRVLYSTNSSLYSTYQYLFGVMLISGWKSAIQWSIFRSWSLFFGAFQWEGQLAGVATWYPGNPMEVVSPLIPLFLYALSIIQILVLLPTRKVIKGNIISYLILVCWYFILIVSSRSRKCNSGSEFIAIALPH